MTMMNDEEEKQVEKDDNNFLSLPAARASKAMFPPGCSVLVCCYDGQKMDGNAFLVSRVVQGTILQVGVHLESREETLYKIGGISVEYEFLAQEEDLQYSMGTPVWFQLERATQPESAVVIGAEHLPVFEDDEMQAKYPGTNYSVQVIAEGNSKIIHGVKPESLSYRDPRKEAKPGVASAKEIENSEDQHNQHQTPTGSKTESKPYSDVQMPIPRRTKSPAPTNTASPLTAAANLKNLVNYAANLPPSPDQPKGGSSGNGTGRVFNQDPFTKFRWIQYANNPGHHILNALDILKKQSRPLPAIVLDSCLRWHLNGFCSIKCNRRYDHVVLQSSRALDLEEALWPATSETGPIYCRRIDPSEYHPPSGGAQQQQGSVYYYGNSRGRSDEDDESPSKRLKLQQHDTTRSPTRYSAPLTAHPPTPHQGPCTSVTLRLPIYVGVSFVVEAIMAETATLCHKFNCSITIDGPALGGRQLSTDSLKNALSAELKGPSLKQLLQCQLEIEEILYQKVHPQLQGYILFYLGNMNGYRDVKEAIVHTRNPFSSGREDDPLVYLAVLKACKGWPNDPTILRFQDAEQCWTERLVHKYPTCRMEMVQETFGLAERIYPFILLMGDSHEAVSSLRMELKYACCGNNS